MDINIPLNNLLKRTKTKTLLGEGSSRKVYDLNNGYILKVAKNNRGIRECDNEWFIYNNISDQYKKFLCPILKHQSKYILMPKIQSYSEIKKTDEFAYQIFDKEIIIRKDVKEFIKYLVETYNIDDFDLTYAFNWGYYNNQIVLLDYGENYLKENLSL